MTASYRLWPLLAGGRTTLIKRRAGKWARTKPGSTAEGKVEGRVWTTGETEARSSLSFPELQRGDPQTAAPIFSGGLGYGEGAGINTFKPLPPLPQTELLSDQSSNIWIESCLENSCNCPTDVTTPRICWDKPPPHTQLRAGTCPASAPPAPWFSVLVVTPGPAEPSPHGDSRPTANLTLLSPSKLLQHTAVI